MSTWIDKQGRRHVGIMVGGKRVHRILPEGASAGDAKRVEAEIRGAIGRSREIAIPGDPPMDVAMAAYVEHTANLRSGDTATMHAQRIGPWTKQYRCSQARECAAHVVKDMTCSYAPATINRSLGAMKKGLKLLWQRGLVPEDYGGRVVRLPENNAREVYLSIDQVRRIAEHCQPQPRAAIMAALLTGARRGELLKVRREHIHANHIEIPSSHTKMLKPRIVPIVPALRPWLESFPLRITFEGVKSAFRRARERAGMPHVHFHDLRHSCASILIELGVDLFTVSKILGHQSVNTTQRYAHMQTSQQRAALNKLSDAMLEKEKRQAL